MFYTSYLQVVYGLDIAHAGYMANIFSIVSCTFTVIISIVFRYTDTYRWAAFLAMPALLDTSERSFGRGRVAGVLSTHLSVDVKSEAGARECEAAHQSNHARFQVLKHSP